MTLQDFPWALGQPNAVLHGQCQSCLTKGATLSLLLLVSSPSYNTSTGLLTFSATKLPGWDASAVKAQLGPPAANGDIIELFGASIVIDTTETAAVNGAEEAVGECRAYISISRSGYGSDVRQRR